MVDEEGRSQRRVTAPNVGVVIDGLNYDNVNISASGVQIKGAALRAAKGDVISFQLTYPKKTKIVTIELKGRIVRIDGAACALEIEPSTVAWQRLLDLHVRE